MDGDDGAEGGCERMGDDDGEERVSECMGGEDWAERVCESMGGDEGEERLCEHGFLCFIFLWLFLFAPAFAPVTDLVLVYTSMDGDDGTEGGCERMGDDDGEERVGECMGGEDRAERVCESIGGDEGVERLCEHAFLRFKFFLLFLFAPAFVPITDIVPVSTSMDGDDGAQGGCERIGDDDGEERVSECMGGDEGAERLCECAFLCFTFFWLFLFSLAFVPTAESLSVFHRNSVPT